jgi:hypothetical protein
MDSLPTMQVATHQLLLKFDIFGARSATLVNRRNQCEMQDTPLGAAAAVLADGKLLDMQVRWPEGTGALDGRWDACRGACVMWCVHATAWPWCLCDAVCARYSLAVQPGQHTAPTEAGSLRPPCTKQRAVVGLVMHTGAMVQPCMQARWCSHACRRDGADMHAGAMVQPCMQARWC